MTGPLVITGTGGSGTRVVAKIAEHAGWSLGKHLNAWMDNVRIARVENHPLGTRFLENGGPTDEQLEHYLSVVDSERWPHERWGWKHPQSMYFMRWLHEAYPETIRVLHVLRDGRDMATSKNVFEHWFGPLLIPNLGNRKSQAFRNAKLWEVSNLRLTRLAEERFPERYHQVRLEDLCMDTHETVSALFDFIEGPSRGIEQACNEVQTPMTLGRWKDMPEVRRRSVQKACEKGLGEYGYIDG